MPSIEYTIIGNHSILKRFDAVVYMNAEAQAMKTMLESFGYEVEIKEKHLIDEYQFIQ